MTNKTSVIIITLVGSAPPLGDPPGNGIEALPAPPPGFCWRFVPDGPFALQFRSILRTDARAAVVWVGAEEAVDRAAELIGRLLGAGLPIVISITQVHDPWSESVLRQAGALYLCANEAQQRLGQVLESILGPSSLSLEDKTDEPKRQIKMDAS